MKIRRAGFRGRLWQRESRFVAKIGRLIFHLRVRSEE